MYGDDSHGLGLGARWLDEERDARARNDEQDAWENARPRLPLFEEETDGE